MDSPRSQLLALVWLCLGAVSPVLAQPAGTEHRRIVVSSIKPASSAALVVEYGLTRDDFARIETLDEIKHCTPIRELRDNAWAGEQRINALVVGTTPSYARLHSLSLQRGRFLTEKDIQQLNNVAVLNERAARELFPNENPIGQNVRIGRNYYLVVGIEATPRVPPDRDQPPRRPEARITLPISTMRSRMGDVAVVRQAGSVSAERYELSRIELEVPNSRADETVHAIGRLLARSHPPGSFRVATRTDETPPESAAPANEREEQP